MHRIFIAAAIAAGAFAAAPARSAEFDPYACFGAARYVAMAESFSCADLPAFCAGARALLTEAGSRAAAEKLARERGHSRMAIMLAKHFAGEGP